MALPRLSFLLLLMALIPLTLFGFSAYNIATQNIETVDHSHIQEALVSTSHILNNVQSTLARTISDYANWDDLHDRVAAGKSDKATKEFFDTNYSPDADASVSAIHKLSTVGVWDANQKLLYSVGPLSDVTSVLNDEIKQTLSAPQSYSMLLSTPAGVFVIALSPIRNSNSEDPNGVLLLGRPIGQVEVEQIKNLTGYDVALYQGTNLIAAADMDVVNRTKTSLLEIAAKGENKMDHHSAENKEWGIAYTPIKDRDGKQVATLVLKHSRFAAISAQTAITATLAIWFGVAAALAAIVAVGLQNIVVKPLMKMASIADKLANGDLTQRIPASSTTVSEIIRVGRAFNRMADKLSERVTESETARKKLEELDEQRLKLLSEITEALQEPMQAINTHSQMLEMEAHGPLNDAQKRSVSSIRTALNTKQTLLADLIDFAQAQKKNLRLTFERLLLPELVNDVYEKRIKERYSKKGVQFITEFPNDLPRITADSMRIEQIIERLLDWAFDLTVPSSRVNLTAVHRGDNVQLIISDMSGGLTDEQRDDLFGLFHRRSTIAGGRFGQTGPLKLPTPGNETGIALTRTALGLAFAQTLIEQQGGSLDLEVHRGVGNTFIVTIPAERVKVAAA